MRFAYVAMKLHVHINFNDDIINCSTQSYDGVNGYGIFFPRLSNNMNYNTK